MIKRIGLVALLLFLLLSPSLVQADSGLLGNLACHSEPFASCHSERSEESHNAQDRLREAPFVMLRAASEDPSLDSFSSLRSESELRLRVTNKQADSGIVVLDSSVEVHFPTALVFNLEAESGADIVDARLHYQVDKINYAQVTSECWPDFAPAARVETNWAWDMRKSSLPPGAAITYWWTMRDSAGNKLETPLAKVHFDDLRYNWQNLNKSDLTLFWYEGDNSFAQELIGACEQGLARLTRDIGTYPEKPIKIYIYSSANDLQGAMIFPQEWTGGVAFTEFGTIAIAISPARIDWGKRALVHELTHLVVHQAIFSPYGTLPTWLDEGLAMYNEGELDPYFRAWLDAAISENKLISVRSLCSPFSAEPEKAYLSYAQSYSLAEYLLDNYGQDKMLSLLTLIKEGGSHDGALTQVYGFDIDGLDIRWRETLTALVVEPPVQGERVWLHPALIAVLSALATSLALWGALALEERTWRRSGRKINQGGRL